VAVVNKEARLFQVIRDRKTFPNFVNPRSFVRTLSGSDAYHLVQAALNDPKYPFRDRVIDAACAALDREQEADRAR
jgi:hypothetical protein